MPDDVRTESPAREARRYALVGVHKDAFDSTLGMSVGADPTQPSPFVAPNAARSVQSNVSEPEEEYQTLYLGAVNSRFLLEPPYMLRMPDRLSQENDALSPYIEVMVVNIREPGTTSFPITLAALRLMTKAAILIGIPLVLSCRASN